MRLIFDTYKKYWYCVKPNKTYIFIIVISKILAVIASILIPFTAAGIVKYLTIANYKEALKWIFYFFAAVTSRVLFYYWNYYGAGLDSNYCYVKLKEKVFDKLSTYDLEFSKRKNIDEILQATSGDIWKVVNINDNLSDILIGAVRIVVIVILTTLTSPFVGEVVLLFSGLYVLFMMLFNNKIAKYLNKQRKYQDKIAGIFLEELSSLEEMKIYDMQDKYYHYFDTVNKKFCHNYRLKRRYEDVQVNFLQLILDLGEVCIYAVTLYLLF
ncbi:TPA: ABC transporter ATP-binding protein [Candidatus Ventrenecus stercoripullorum]|nr:ABC transporter ATP-binding protein [Candidatus Ventrenecus stercoripullorum]